MIRSLIRFSVLILFVVAVLMNVPARAKNPRVDFGSWVQDQLSDHSEQLFGFRHPLAKSARGPYIGLDNVPAIQVADGLQRLAGIEFGRVGGGPDCVLAQR